jgi:hypothetical protein
MQSSDTGLLDPSAEDKLMTERSTDEVNVA